MSIELRPGVNLAALRDVAVAAVMRLGRFEKSESARLAVLRQGKFMITYRTPFNPLPPLSDFAKHILAREGRTASFLPYGIDVWQVGVGKLLSIGWRSGKQIAVDSYRPNGWEHAFEEAVALLEAPSRAFDGAVRAKCVAEPLKNTRHRKPGRELAAG